MDGQLSRNGRIGANRGPNWLSKRTSQSPFPLWPMWLKLRTFRNFHCQNNANCWNPVAYCRKSHRFNAYASWATFDTNNCSNFATPGAYGRKSHRFNAYASWATFAKKNIKISIYWKHFRHLPEERPRSARGAPKHCRPQLYKKKQLPIVRSSGCYWY